MSATRLLTTASAPEILQFPPARCTPLGKRFKCFGTRSEVLSARRKANGLFAVKITARQRAFTPPLSTAAVTVTLSLASVDRRDEIPGCTTRLDQRVATCKK